MGRRRALGSGLARGLQVEYSPAYDAVLNKGHLLARQALIVARPAAACVRNRGVVKYGDGLVDCLFASPPNEGGRAGGDVFAVES